MRSASRLVTAAAALLPVLCGGGGASALPAGFSLPVAHPGEGYLMPELTFSSCALQNHPRRSPEHLAVIRAWLARLRALCERSSAEVRGLRCGVDESWPDPLRAGQPVPRVFFRLDDHGALLRTVLPAPPGAAPLDGAAGPQQLWWYTLESQNQVIAVTTRPMTLRQAALAAPALASVFETARALRSDLRDECDGEELHELAPHPFLGGGHLHLDAESAFQGSPTRMLNFLTGVFNLGMLPFHRLDRHGMQNALPFSLLGQGQRAAFRDLLARAPGSVGYEALVATAAEVTRLYGLGLGHPFRRPTARLPSVAAEGPLFMEVDLRTLAQGSRVQPGAGAAGPLWNSGTVELRGLAPQRSVRDLLLELRLFSERARLAPDEVLLPLDPQLLETRSVIPWGAGDLPASQPQPPDGDFFLIAAFARLATRGEELRLRSSTLQLRRVPAYAQRVAAFFSGTGVDPESLAHYFPQGVRAALRPTHHPAGDEQEEDEVH